MTNYWQKLGSISPARMKTAVAEALDQRAADHLNLFVRRAFRVLEPATAYTHGWHIDLICEYMQAVDAGEVKRLVINVPPRHMKSLLASVCYPAWSWIKTPQKRFLKVSYAESLARRHNILTRDVINSGWYQQNWASAFALKDDMNRQSGFMNNRGGQMLAVGVGGAITGEGGDVLIVDDPQNPLMAYSPIERENSIQFFRGTLQTRLNDPKRGAIVIIMQRLHEKDLTGYVLAEQLGYELLKLPAIGEEEQIVRFPLSGAEIPRAEGELLCPDRIGARELEALKKTMGGAQFAAQMQQRPAPEQGSIFRREWLKRTYREIPAGLRAIMSWDLPFTKSEHSAQCACVVLGRRGSELYVLDVVAEKMSFTDSARAMEAIAAKWPDARAKVIENKANGAALIDLLKGEIGGLVAYNPRGGKAERAQRVAPYFEAGNVLFPEKAAWLSDLIEALIAFPGGRYLDSVDALVQGIDYLMGGSMKASTPVLSEKRSYWR